MNKNIILVGAVAIGLYLFSQAKKIPFFTEAQKTARRSPPATTPTTRQRTAQKVAQKVAQKKVAPKRIGQPTTQAARIAAARKAAVRKAAAQKIGKKIGKKVARKVDISKLPVQQLRYLIAHAAVHGETGKEVAALKAEVTRREAAYSTTLRKQAAQKIGKIIGKKVAQKVAQKKVASWKAPYKFPNSTFRVITPTKILQNLAKKDIARKKALQQKKVQKTTPSTPSARRKKRLEALYGSHWHDIWVQRQRR